MKNRITIKNSVKIISSDKINYVVKKKSRDLDNTYKYLLSRSFDYFPSLLSSHGDYYVYEYISDIVEPKEQKIIDMISLLSLLHSKTTFYKEVDVDYFKDIYEKVNNEIDDTYNYYNELINNIDNIVYMSPSNYLIARNISIIYSMINYSKYNIDKWYDMIKDKRKVRMVNIHNNLKLEHYLKSNNKSYFISWDNSRIDNPIYDIISLYENNYLDFDFSELFKIYLSKYPLHDDEIILLFTYLSIPKKIKYTKTEYLNVLNIRTYLDYIYKTSDLLSEYGKKEETK